MAKQGVEHMQNAFRKNSLTPKPSKGVKTLTGKAELVRLPADHSGSLSWWAEQYFKFEVTTAESSQAVQRRGVKPN